MDCNKCGSCCKFLKFSIGGIDDALEADDIKKWLMLHKGVIVKDDYVYIQTRCNMLKDDNTCAINQDKPNNCKNLKCGSAICLEAKDIKNMEILI